MEFIISTILFLHVQLLCFGATLKSDTGVLSGLLEKGRGEGNHFIPSREITKVGSLFQDTYTVHYFLAMVLLDIILN